MPWHSSLRRPHAVAAAVQLAGAAAVAGAVALRGLAQSPDDPGRRAISRHSAARAGEQPQPHDAQRHQRVHGGGWVHTAAGRLQRRQRRFRADAAGSVRPPWGGGDLGFTGDSRPPGPRRGPAAAEEEVPRHEGVEESRRLGIRALQDGQEFRVPGTTAGVMRTLYTPGHCTDHVCFLLDGVEELDAPVLFSGDCVLGFGSCVFDSLADLMKSLTKLKACGAATIYPGHGPVVKDAPAKILEYITHRQQREDEVLDVLKKHNDRQEGLSMSEIVDEVYEPLPYFLQFSARKAVDKHLQKLLTEHRVRQARRAGWFQAATYSLS
ncbi:hypothetical protein ON010_g3594 [Phytophthora cinnamomi]|nr:hypothetical protein ON010_g3594 [Phytophthora cinnamomi]